MPDGLDRNSKAEQQVAKAVACRATSAYGVCRCQARGCRSHSRVRLGEPPRRNWVVKEGTVCPRVLQTALSFSKLTTGIGSWNVRRDAWRRLPALWTFTSS